MSTSHVTTKKFDLVKAKIPCVSIGTLPQDAQLTTRDTGWSDEEKDRMRQAGYDGVDMVMAWYS